MTVWLRQSTAATLLLGPYLDSTDGVTPETALAPTVRLARAGGAWGARSDATAIAHTENGFYSVPLDATDTGTLGRLDLASVVAGAAPVWDRALVLPAQVWDSLLSTDRLQVHAAEISPALITPTTFAANAINDAAVAADVTIAAVTGAVGSVTGAVGSVTAPVTAGTVTDKAGYALSATGVQAIWDRLTTALTTAGSVGKLLVDQLNATVGSRLAAASYTTPPTVGAIADQVWDEATSDHQTTGSTGASLNAAGSAGDPWSTILPAAYGAGTAGQLLGDNLDAPVSSLRTIGDGAITHTHTVYRAPGVPAVGAIVRVTTDVEGAVVVASGRSDTFGTVRFQLDAGAYYFWQRLAGVSFTPNPLAVTVA